MKLLYILAILLYRIATNIATLFNIKAKLRIKGIKKDKKFNIENKTQKHIWFHCASLGEFEQGRPLIEKIKTSMPDSKIILSFFSPSGYEIRKNYQYADIVCYLPFDTKKNAQDFINRYKPDIAIFIKYEFWFFFIETTKKNNIPLYLVSGIFRNSQMFFKPYGSFFRNDLKNFTYFFLQDNNSKLLLEKINVLNAETVGDTRFDRVAEIAASPAKFNIVDAFKSDKKIFIAGSTWPADISVISDFINNNEFTNIKFIIVPHEIDNEKIKALEKVLTRKYVRFSEATKLTAEQAEILIVDKIGYLSSLYGYGDIAYIGGGFGAGIHNTLEAAVFGLPLIFGPNFKKFNEALHLIEIKAAFSINSKSEFNEIVLELLKNEIFRISAGQKSAEFVKENTGAVTKILDKILKN